MLLLLPIIKPQTYLTEQNIIWVRSGCLLPAQNYAQEALRQESFGGPGSAAKETPGGGGGGPDRGCTGHAFPGRDSLSKGGVSRTGSRPIWSG
jgi:hypothetical protein